jgi:hypothetical protein
MFVMIRRRSKGAVISRITQAKQKKTGAIMLIKAI